MEKYDFGNRLYEYRTQKGLTQKELGKLLGVTDKAVSKWETGESKPRLDKMNQITELFETSIDDMLGKETADGEQLKPYKTIFEARLEKFSKYYKAARIWTYIFAILCVVFLAIDSVIGLLNGNLAPDRISSLIEMIILTSSTVIFTLIFKPKFNECKIKDMNSFMAFIFAVFLLVSASPVVTSVRIGKATGENDTVTIGFIGVEALILTVIAIISLLKKRYVVFTIFILGFSTFNLFEFETDVSDYFLVIYATATQFACFIKKRNWLTLAEKADLEIKKAVGSTKAANVFIAIVAIITVLGIAFSSFSPYIIYKTYLKEYYSSYEKDTILDYDYSAKFDEELTEIEFEGAKFRIPKGYKKLSGSDGIAFYKNDKTNGVISISYNPLEEMYTYDESDIESLEPDEAEKVRADRAKIRIVDSLYQKYFGVSTDTHYGFEYLTYIVDLEDVKFYESRKAVLMCSILVMKSVTSTESSMSVSSFDNGVYCGFVAGRPVSENSVMWSADIWHSNNKEGAYYTITYSNRGKTNITDNQMICKLVNSLEF